MTYFYASFGDGGDCLGVTSSPVELGWLHPVPAGSNAEDLYFDGTEIQLRTVIEISADREYYFCDGLDIPEVGGLPENAILEVDGIVGGTLLAHEPAVISIQAAGKYRSNALWMRFDTPDNIRAEFAKQVDQAAGAARLSVITDSPGQAAVYAAKLAEAQRCLAGDDGPFLFVSDAAEAEIIVQRAAVCNAEIAEIETKRMAAKSALSNAATIADMLGAVGSFSYDPA